MSVGGCAFRCGVLLHGGMDINMKSSIIIPALNESQTIGEVIRQCRQYSDEVIVVDGHSTDSTVRIAHRNHAIIVVDNQKGKGDALRQAALKATGDTLVFIDADGSHDPHDIPGLLAPIAGGEAELVVASRLLGGSSELHGGFAEFLRLSGSSFITECINKRFNTRLSDSQNGFRAIRRDVFLSLNLKSNDTTIEQEMIFQILKQKHRIVEVPSHEYARRAGESKIKLSRVWYRYLFSLISGLA